MKKVAVFCGMGIGDALIMMIASHHFQKAGYEVTTYTPQLAGLGPWVKDFAFARFPEVSDYENVMSQYDTIVLQNENSHRAKAIFALREKGKTIISFYNNYRASKHPPLDPRLDFAFDETIPMADNVALAMQKLLQVPFSKEIGLTIPPGLQHKKYPKRVIIHPTSSLPCKNWWPQKFATLANKLIKRGYQPVFVVSSKERNDWIHLESSGSIVPHLPTLADLANWLYESGYFIGNDSGPGHLASYLQIPSLILASVKQSISHWRPAWHPSTILLPPSWVPNMKGLRLRQNYWQFFVTTRKVLNSFIAI